MKKSNLKSVANITTGKLDSNYADNDGIYPFFTCAPEPLRINTYCFDCNAIMIAGNNAQGIFHINRYNGKFNAYQRTYVVTAKESYNIDYIYYNLKIALKQLKNKSQGSQTKFLTLKILENLPIEDIYYKNQLRITNILGSLDKKIEINQKKISELEETAKLIYDYWFVQFDFPDENGKPYKSSGGKMVYNDVLKREIPVGWENDKITNTFKIIMGSSPKGDSINECKNGTLFFQGKVDFNYRYPIERTYTTMPIKLAMKNDILLSVRAPVGDVNIALTDCCIGRGVAAIRGFYSSYTYYTIKNLKPILDKYNNSGTTFGSINKDDLKNIMIVQVPDDIQKEFNNTVNPIDLLIEKLSMENIKLICLRDWLLPMLMNGQVEVIE